MKYDVWECTGKDSLYISLNAMEQNGWKVKEILVLPRVSAMENQRYTVIFMKEGKS